MRAIFQLCGRYVSQKGLTALLYLPLLIAAGRAEQPDFEQYAERSKQERPKALAKAQKELVALRKNRELNRAERAAAVDKLESRIADLQNPLRPYYADADFSLNGAEVGNIGWFADKEVGVAQVIDESNALLEITWFISVVVKAEYPAQIQSRRMSKRMWLSGVSTSGMEDGRSTMLNGLFAVTGSKTYETANGSNTVLVLESIDSKEHEEKFTRREELRTWTAKSGHTRKAIFAGYQRGSVKLMNLDGKSMNVRLTDLSDEDRKYVREQIKAAAKDE